MIIIIIANTCAKHSLTEVQLIYNVVFVSDVQQSDSVNIYIFLFQILFHYRVL